MADGQTGRIGAHALRVCSQGSVHTTPFSNENAAVLLRFQKDFRPHYRFRIVFARPRYIAVSV